MKKLVVLLIMICLFLAACQETKTKPTDSVVTKESPLKSTNPTPSAVVKVEATRMLG